MDTSRSWRLVIEESLGQWAHTVARHRIAILIALTIGTGFLASFIPQLEVKMASEDFLFEDDPVRARYDTFKEDFGQDQIAILSIRPPEVFDLVFLERLAAFHRDLENEVPFLEDLTSLVNVRSTYGRGDELVVEDLLDELPTTEAELRSLEERVRSTPFYVKAGILSDDARATGVRVELAVYGDGLGDGAIAGSDGGELDLGGFEDASAVEAEAVSGKRPFLNGAQNAQVIEAIHRVIARHEKPDFPVMAAGGTMMVYEFTKQLGVDVPRFFGGGLVVIGLVLFILFRRIAPVLVCVAVVVPATLSTFGLASLLRIAFSAPAQLIPSFLLAIGVSYSVHLITIFLDDLAGGRDRLASLEHAMRHSGLPILMTGVTTSAGLLSFLAAELKPIQEMGMISSIGVAVMLVYAMVLLPALLALIPIQPRARKQGTIVDRGLAGLAAASARHPWTIIALAALIVLSAIYSMTRLHSSSDPVSWFPRDHPYAVAADILNYDFGGQSAFEVIVDTGREDGLKDPSVMARLDAIEARIEALKADGARLTHTNSIVDIAKETHQALNRNNSAYYVVPTERDLLAQELLLFENSGSDDLEKVVDTEFRHARYTIRTHWTDGVHVAPFLSVLEEALQETMGDLADIQLTGMTSVIARTVVAVIESMLRSYALALALITPLMIILIGSLRSGLVSMVPNLAPIILTLGLMGAIGIPIDMFTLLAGCIAIGLAVDDSIHFISGFRRYLAQGHDPIAAVERTMQSTGRALLFTSAVLVSGFAVLLLSEMLNLRNVGALTTFAIASAFLFDVTVTPALLVLTHRRQMTVAEESSQSIAA